MVTGTGPKFPRKTIPHIRIVAGGTLGDGQQEIWSCTMKVCSFQTQTSVAQGFEEIIEAVAGAELGDLTALLNGDSLQDGLVNYADNFAVPAWKAFANQALTSAGDLRYVKVNVFGGDDLQVNETTLDRQFTPVGGGGNHGQFSSAVVVEFRTTHKSRGLATHGRISLPVAAIVGYDGQISTVGQANQATNMIPAVKTFLSSLNGPSTTGHQLLPAIVYTQDVGRVYENPAVNRAPQANAIDSFLVSTIPGVIRKRQNAIKQGGQLQGVNYGPAT